jgi:hypothetical protein
LEKVKLRLDGEMRARRGMLNKDDTIIESRFWRQDINPEGTSNERATIIIQFALLEVPPS